MPKAIGGFKICSKCKTTKPVEEFSRLAHATDELHSWCKVCMTSNVKTARTDVRTYNKNARPFAFELIDEYTARVPVKMPGGWLFTLIDAADVEVVAAFKWNLMGSGYAMTYDSDGRIVTMHRMLLGLVSGDKRVADHINGDQLDNRRSNLRIATHASNLRNVKKQRRNNSIGYMGVRKTTVADRWIARCTFEGKVRHLGTFKTPEDAARAFDRFVIANFDEYAFTNFDRASYTNEGAAEA